MLASYSFVSYNIIKEHEGDGNCMFRALSYLITGTQAQHLGVRAAIVRHLLQYVATVLGINCLYNSLQYGMVVGVAKILQTTASPLPYSV